MDRSQSAASFGRGLSREVGLCWYASSTTESLLTRNRDPSVKITYTIVSEATFASRQSIDIWWTKPQEPPAAMPESDVEVIADPTRFTFTMQRVAASDAKQSEAYIATSALFHVFSGNAREEKANLRLPAVWRDLWNELAEAKKEQLDSEDRAVVRSLRTLVRQRHDQELEDGVILQGAFRGRGGKAAQDSSDSADRKKPQTLNPDEFKKIWADKSGTRKFQQMLVRNLHRPSRVFTANFSTAITNAASNVAIQTTSARGRGQEPSCHRLW